MCRCAISNIDSGGSKVKVTWTLQVVLGQPLSFFFLQAPAALNSSIEDLRTGGCWFESPAWPIFFPRINNSHCDRIHSTLTAVHSFLDGSVGKQPLAWKEYCAEYWLKELLESMDRCTGC